MKTGTKSYSEKLKDPRWQKKRLEILDRAGFVCEDCGSKDKTLHVHHEYYVTGRHPWDYPNWALRSLCWGCHNERHEEGYEIMEGGEERPRRYEWEEMVGWIADLDESGSQSPGNEWDAVATFVMSTKEYRSENA